MITKDIQLLTEAYHQARNLQKLRKDFAAVGAQQRGTPETLMLRWQHILGGGVLSFIAEHVGDLSHRASELYADGRPMGYPYIKEKLDKCIHTLTREYGFDREREENLTSNTVVKLMDIVPELRERYQSWHTKMVQYRASHNDENWNDAEWDELIKRKNASWWSITTLPEFRELRSKMDAEQRKAGKAYADAHRTIVKPLTTLQRMGQQAAIAVGEYRFDECTSILREMDWKINQAEREGKLNELYFEGYSQ